MSAYGWIITRDFIDDDTPYERWGKDSVPVDVSGPRDATPEQLAKAAADGAPFKIYDDDGIKYYEGRFWADDESGCGRGDCRGHACRRDTECESPGQQDHREQGD